jgi:hypothetical protein
MKRKRVPEPRVAPRVPVNPRETDERESWLQWLAPIVFGVGLGFVLLLSPMTLLMATGGYGDCFDVACEADRRFWASLGIQTVGWFLAVALLAILAHRANHHLWLVVAAFSAMAAMAGLVSAQLFLDTDPQLFGIDVPAISPAFIPWIPGSLLMSVGALMIWLGAQQALRASRDIPAR